MTIISLFLQNQTKKYYLNYSFSKFLPFHFFEYQYLSQQIIKAKEAFKNEKQ